MQTTEKRVPIRKKIQQVVLIIAAAALLISAAVGIISMLVLRKSVSASGAALGDTAANESSDMLLTQTEQSLLDIVSDKSSLADEKLGKYMKYANLAASYIESLYKNPSSVNAAEILPPSVANKGVLAMQRNLAYASLNYADLADEISLLGNVQSVFKPIMNQENDLVTSVYLGTESGFLLSYDAYSDTAAAADGGEAYYNYLFSEWYVGARDAGQAIFTDAYQDGYGRGLTITCAAPFYDASGAFAGVVSMDILIADLNAKIIDIAIGDGAYAFLLNNKGNVIASPYMDAVSVNKTYAAIRSIADTAMSGEIGFVQSTDDVYYAYAPIAISDWTIVINVPATLITAPADAVRSTISENTTETNATISRQILLAISIFAAAFVVIIISVIILSRNFAKRLTKPLTALEADAAQISAGNLEHQAAVSGNDEIGDLAKSFNSMTVSLRKYISDLTSVTAEKERIGAELDVAAKIQADMLPCIFPAFPGRNEFDIYATMKPAKEVGGDFYDFFLVDDDHLALVMADVSGKGVPAALFMMISKTLLKSAAQAGATPKEILENVNNQLCENNEAEMFVTVWLGILEISSGKMTCANAGHEYPALKRRDGSFELIKNKHGMVLAGIENAKYKEYEMQLNPGDALFVYTDGVAEATDAHNELFGTDRMLDALNSQKGASCNGLLDVVHSAIDDFVGSAPQFDDITMLCVQIADVTAKKLNPQENTMQEAMNFVDAQLEQSDVPPSVQMKMDIAVDEMYSNIMKYSTATEATVECKAENGVATIIFTDNGIPYDPTAKPDPDVTLSAEERQIGGLGIYTVKKVMDSMEYRYENDKNILTLKKGF